MDIQALAEELTELTSIVAGLKKDLERFDDLYERDKIFVSLEGREFGRIPSFYYFNQVACTSSRVRMMNYFKRVMKEELKAAEERVIEITNQLGGKRKKKAA